MNRQMRRQQTRQKMREWVRDGTAERVRKMSVNGITPDYLEKERKAAYEEGYKYATTAFIKGIYAAIAKELIDAGNQKEEIYAFIYNVDQRFCVMYDADEEATDVLKQIGVRLNIKHDGISTIERCF